MFYWGLVVVFSAFMMQFIAFGIAFSIGIYNLEFLEEFESSVAATSLIGSICLGMFLGAGPVASFLMNKMSYRCVALIGAFLSSLGLFCVRFATNVAYLYVFLGVFTGLGFCLLYVPSHALCGLYFDKHRCLATGVATSGSGLGGFAFPVFIHYLIETYTWRGSVLILAGINLHQFVFAWSLRPTDMYSAKKLCKDTPSADHRKLSSRQKSVVDLAYPPSDDISVSADVSDFGDEQRLDNSVEALPTNESTTTELVKVPTANESAVTDHEQVVTVKTPSTTELEQVFLVNESELGQVLPTNESELEQELSTNEFELDQELPTNDFELEQELPTNESELEQELPTNDFELEQELPTNESTAEYEQVLPRNELNIRHRPPSKKKHRRHFYVLFSISFFIYCINNIGWNVGFGVFNVLGPEYYTDLNMVKSEAAWAVSLNSLGMFIGSVSGSVIGNVKWINRIWLYITCNILLGVVSLFIICPLFLSFAGISCVNFVFGSLIGVLLALLVAVVADILGAESLGDGLGYLMLANGIGNILGPPLGGWLKDFTGNFFLSFLLNGLFILFSALITVMIPIRMKLCKKKNQGLSLDRTENIISPNI